MKPNADYDVVLSFAGEDREYAEALAKLLAQMNIKVFYDYYEKSALWGKDLYSHLSDIYQNRGRYCVMFLSKNYAAKLWTNHERKAAQSRAFYENEEYILPVRLDDTEIPGILPTIGFLSWPPEDAESIAEAVVAKLRAKCATDDAQIHPQSEGEFPKPVRPLTDIQLTEFSGMYKQQR